ncbi:hypothetical protein NP493_2327g00000 [Ridgeia piscesae]|uniref:Uncharacterized protein n=1 Tax=Ridgeia piscesae TaxID=27915 RepID=A0AAD9JHY4_RIDPI|nr:hypothetical protein NP493_2327g00000 [Ridgeia piscesae]
MYNTRVTRFKATTHGSPRLTCVSWVILLAVRVTMMSPPSIQQSIVTLLVRLVHWTHARLRNYSAGPVTPRSVSAMTSASGLLRLSKRSAVSWAVWPSRTFPRLDTSALCSRSSSGRCLLWCSM